MKKKGEVMMQENMFRNKHNGIRQMKMEENNVL